MGFFSFWMFFLFLPKGMVPHLGSTQKPLIFKIVCNLLLPTLEVGVPPPKRNLIEIDHIGSLQLFQNNNHNNLAYCKLKRAVISNQQVRDCWLTNTCWGPDAKRRGQGFFLGGLGGSPHLAKILSIPPSILVPVFGTMLVPPPQPRFVPENLKNLNTFLCPIWLLLSL